MEKEKPRQPVAVFRVTCPKCKTQYTLHATRADLKKYIKGIDRAVKKRKAT